MRCASKIQIASVFLLASSFSSVADGQAGRLRDYSKEPMYCPAEVDRWTKYHYQQALVILAKRAQPGTPRYASGVEEAKQLWLIARKREWLEYCNTAVTRRPNQPWRP